MRLLTVFIQQRHWLAHYHGRVFKRRVGRNGLISVGNHTYYVGYAHAGTPVGVLLDAEQRVFRVQHRSTILCEKGIQGLYGRLMPFQMYLKHMLAEAQTIDRN